MKPKKKVHKISVPINVSLPTVTLNELHQLSELLGEHLGFHVSRSKAIQAAVKVALNHYRFRKGEETQ